MIVSVRTSVKNTSAGMLTSDAPLSTRNFSVIAPLIVTGTIVVDRQSTQDADAKLSAGRKWAERPKRDRPSLGSKAVSLGNKAKIIRGLAGIFPEITLPLLHKNESGTLAGCGQALPADRLDKLKRSIWNACTRMNWRRHPAVCTNAISPYRSEHSNRPQNDLLLRADLHLLFDLGLIAIDPISMKVVVSSQLTCAHYRALDGQTIGRPRGQTLNPSPDALKEHLKRSRIASR